MTRAEMALHATREPGPFGPVDALAVHAVNADRACAGGVFGWRDDDSPTGYWSGLVVRTGPCVVYVRDIRPGMMKPS